MKLYCPNCQQLLINNQTNLKCPDCKKIFHIKNKIPRFINTNFYWGEIPQKQMQDINQQIRNIYWKDVLKNYPSEQVKSKYNFISNLNRGNYHYQFCLNRDAKVLDIGSGLGTISQSLSYYYDKVTAIEPVDERIEFSSIRFQQENCYNISLIQTDLSNLPFKSESFDLVMMNGILEWVGISDTTKAPELVQHDILQNLYRLLKPGGILCIGIENRIGFTFFYGRIDHSWMPYTSLLPRYLANMITLYKKGDQYRTYTYSYYGFRNLLSRSGFSKSTFYYPHTGYNIPNKIIPLEDGISKKYFADFTMSKSFLKRTIKNLILYSGSFKLLSPDFIIKAEKKGIKGKSKIKNFIKQGLKIAGYKQKIQDFTLILHCTSSKHITYLVILENYPQPVLVVTVSLKDEYNKDLEKSYNKLLDIHCKYKAEFTESIPVPILLKYYSNRVICIKTYINGESLPMEYNLKTLNKISKKVTKWLSVFYISFISKDFINQDFIQNNLDYPLKEFIKDQNLKISDQFNAWLERTKNGIIDCKYRLSPQHGDFWHGNIVLGKQIGVFDWEFFKEVNIPLFDLFHFLTMYLTAPDNSINQRKDNYLLLFSDNKISKIFYNRTKEIVEILGIDFNYASFLYFLYLLNFYEKISKGNLNKPLNEQLIEFINKFINNHENFVLNH